jgi:hypothetical protein
VSLGRYVLRKLDAALEALVAESTYDQIAPLASAQIAPLASAERYSREAVRDTLLSIRRELDATTSDAELRAVLRRLDLLSPPTAERGGMTDEERVLYVLRSSLHASTLPNEAAQRHIAQAIIGALRDT